MSQFGHKLPFAWGSFRQDEMSIARWGVAATQMGTQDVFLNHDRS
jgi:hypothetical protein